MKEWLWKTLDFSTAHDQRLPRVSSFNELNLYFCAAWDEMVEKNIFFLTESGDVI